MDRIILHCDLNNFYASVECTVNPELKNVPLVIAGDGEKRHGVVLAKNELAKKAGIKTGDVLWQARRKAQGLVCAPPRFELYGEYSKKVFELYTRYTPLVEAFGGDECWLDLTGCEGYHGKGAVAIADEIRERVKRETGLTASVGVSFNKVFAKLGSDLKKPDATTEVLRANFKKLVWPLPCGEMLGVGKQSVLKLAKLDIVTIGDLAAADEQLLRAHFGINGVKMKENASGENREPVRAADDERAAESIGHGMTATKDIVSAEEAEALIFYLADLVAVRLRKKSLKGRGVAVTLRYTDLKSVSRQCKTDGPVNTSEQIGRAAAELLRANWKGAPPLRTMTVSVFALCPDSESCQLSMFDTEKTQKNESLERAIDKLRGKYGAAAVRRGNLVERDFFYDKNDAEDFLPFKR